MCFAREGHPNEASMYFETVRKGTALGACPERVQRVEGCQTRIDLDVGADEAQLHLTAAGETPALRIATAPNPQ